MNILKEIFRKDDINTQGKTLNREAVRGIILQARSILMVYSPVNEDYKFPGGGVDVGESYADALTREVREECGARVSQIEREVGCVLEYDSAREPDYDVFTMTSHYYLCSIAGGFHEQCLDRYEQDLGFCPVWVDIDAAIHANNRLLQCADRKTPSWTVRETFVLQYIHKHLLS